MQKNLEKPIAGYLSKINAFHILVISILILTIFSRLIGLGDRVMSHDEVNHVVPSFDLFTGRGYRHDPVTHGPLQFHLMALSYFLFGDSDFSSRLPHALFSIATVGFVMVYFKRYLGRFGALAGGLLFAISPFMVFYGRYARNDAICAFLSVAAIYAVLRYLESGRAKYLAIFSVMLSLNFAAKETAYIFTAILMVFVFILAVFDFMKTQQVMKDHRIRFLMSNLLVFGMIAILVVVSIFMTRNTSERLLSGQILLTLPAVGGTYTFFETIRISLNLLIIALPIVLPLVASLVLLYLAKDRLMWSLMKNSRPFDLVLLNVIFVLPILAPFLVKFSGLNPIAYTDPFTILADYIYLIYLSGLGVVIGIVWNKENWWKFGLIFYGIYIVLFSTFFTNTVGLLTGPIGSLGHWLAQQTERRGGQPDYYYALILLPIYEFLSVFGSIVAFIIGLRRKSFWKNPKHSKSQKDESNESVVNELQAVPVPAIFLYFSIMSLIAYSLAGEKMPWLTVHIAFPLILGAAWAINKVIKKFINLDNNHKKRWLLFCKVAVFVFIFLFTILRLLGNQPPFQGKTQAQLQATNHFIFLLILLSLSGYLLLEEIRKRGFKSFWITSILVLFLVMGILTVRTTYQAAFINYDYPNEFLVYAHAADGPKIVLEQIEEISRRTTQGLNIKVAYDNHGLYPYWWYLRNYPNKIVYLESPTRALEEAPLIIAGSDKYAKIDAITRDNYYAYEYMRLWWPMQDYWNLNFDRIKNAILDANLRQSIFNIWLDRNYDLYAHVTDNQYLTLGNWLPSEKMRFYVRKDIAAQMWQLNNPAALQIIETIDPYSENMISKQPDIFFGRQGSLAGDLSSPKGLDVSMDGSIFVADTNNNRIQQFSPTGEVLNVWGTYASIIEGQAPGGTLNQPWDVAVSKAGFVYVADTFNHRIVKFSNSGQFIKMIGVFAQGANPDSLWGPRGIAVDPLGNVLITDTGNKRVVVYDNDLNYITQFGSAGIELGQFDEPVGIAVSANGDVAVADTWNRRVQIFRPDESGLVYSSTGEFSVEAWFGQSLDNKPYLTFSPYGTIFLSDPEGARILEFTLGGEFVRGWQDLSISEDLFSQPYGLDFDPAGNLWVADSSMNVLMSINFHETGIESGETVTEGSETTGGIVIPVFPENTQGLVINPSADALLDNFGKVIYQLDVELNEWVPVIPTSLELTLSDGSQIKKDESKIWHILDKAGTALYAFDQLNFEWIDLISTSNSELDASDIASEIQTCEGANPSRISGIGAMARVINSLIPLRYSPNALEQNIITGLSIGTRLEITSDPLCIPYLGGANLWWGVKTSYGISGYVAEGSAISLVYYLEEIN
jgi:predicted membrane-bound mannosyltransferase/DNA-binding beta-propeller fold protein YncE